MSEEKDNDPKKQNSSPVIGKHSLAKAQMIGPMKPDEEMTVTVLVRRPAVHDLLQRQNLPLSRKKFAAEYGASTADLTKVKTFAVKNHLTVRSVQQASGTVILAGKTQDINRAFGVKMEKYQQQSRVFRSYRESISLPDQLSGIIDHVFGLDTQSHARTHFQMLEKERIIANKSNLTPFTPNEVARLYDFPANRPAAGSCIGLIELGGGYHLQEIRDYFQKLGVAVPELTAVSVNGAQNQPTDDPNGPDGEVVLDIEVAGAAAPGTKIAVYFASNTDAGFLNAINTAVHDQKNHPEVISISWGNAESEWTEQAMLAMDRAFQDARALGVSICCAAGDRGSSDGVNDGLVHVDFPSSSPNVLGCGGTRLTGSGTAIAAESVWNDGPDSSTGGGVSEIFPLPDWQKQVQVPPSANPDAKVGRGVPDIAGNADPQTGYRILVDGQEVVIGGTSAVAPLWAGLIVLINQNLGRSAGFLNQVIYDQALRSALHDIIKGNNDSSRNVDAYQAHAGWDACTGLGSPSGNRLVALLQKKD
ncbi:MAG: S53 family peptidase [Sporolactobacillus sp.]|jgi:kumamolisin|nr:S53 family peptidase [Sporolactobacillus sp.]